MASRGWRRFGSWAMFALSLSLVCCGSVGVAKEAGADPDSEKSNQQSEKYDLTSSRTKSSVWNVVSSFEVGGELTVAGDKKVKKLPMSVVAQLDYEERALDSKHQLRSVRHYDKAEATIKVGRGGIQSKLDDEHKQIVVDAKLAPTTSGSSNTDARISMFSPDSELSRNELDLIAVVGNSLILPKLLPKSPVAVGEYWSHDSNTIAALVGVEAVASCEVQSVIGSVDGNRVTISLAGSLQGASEGAATEIDMKANYQFDLESRRITQFNLAVQEKRPMGHVSPGVDVTAKLKMLIEPLQEANELTAEVVSNLQIGSNAKSPRLLLDSPDGSYQLLHDPKWFVTNESSNQLVLRRVDRGDLIAQCNLTRLPKVNPQRHLTLQQFQKNVQFTLGDRFDQFTAAGQRENRAGYREFRVVARGKVKDLPIEWHYYLLADREGHRVSAVFTVDASLVQQLGDSDRKLVAGITLLDNSAKSETASSKLPSAPEPTPQPTASRPSETTSR